MADSAKTELLINAGVYETRLAVIEDGVLQEVHIERSHCQGLVGNIYKGVVVRVLPGMQAAFVDIGLERAGFIHVGEVMPFRDPDAQAIDFSSPDADIRKWLKEGQEILVQVLKDPLGAKGARLTTHLSVAARFLVYMPDLNYIGVSVRLEDEAERERLQKLVGEILKVEQPCGYIIRTVAEGASAKELGSDMTFLQKIWQTISDKASQSTAPAIIHEDLPLYKRAIRDMVNDNVERVRIDDESVYDELIEFSRCFMSGIEDKLTFYQNPMSIFDMYGVESDLQNALERRVPLKSGGYLVIDQTEAMTTIDVNTGGYVGSLNLEETAFKTNLEAAQVIAHQVRLRNLGGIIILDFIDMTDEAHKQQLIETLERVLAHDHARTHVSDISPLGLVQMTRKRTQESLQQQLCEACPTCGGRGMVKSLEALCNEMMRDLVRQSRTYENASGFIVIAHYDLVHWLSNEESQRLAELEACLNKPLRLKGDTMMPREQYDVVLM